MGEELFPHLFPSYKNAWWNEYLELSDVQTKWVTSVVATAARASLRSNRSEEKRPLGHLASFSFAVMQELKNSAYEI